MAEAWLAWSTEEAMGQAPKSQGENEVDACLEQFEALCKTLDDRLPELLAKYKKGWVAIWKGTEYHACSQEKLHRKLREAGIDLRIVPIRCLDYSGLCFIT